MPMVSSDTVKAAEFRTLTVPAVGVVLRASGVTVKVYFHVPESRSASVVVPEME